MSRATRCTTPLPCPTSRSPAPAQPPRTDRGRRWATSRRRSSALEFINAAGDLVTLSRETDGDTFAGAVVGLGGLGVVTKLTLDLQPAFSVRQDVYRDLPLAALEAHFDEIMASGYSVSLFTDLRGDTVEQVWIKSAVGAGETFAAKPSFFDARPATENMHPLAGLDAVNCTEQMGVAGPWYDRLPHFRMGFTPASGEELQVEYFVPLEHAVAAVKALYRHGDRIAPLLMISEVRTIAADDLWISPGYRQPCVAFHFSFKLDWSALRLLLPSRGGGPGAFSPAPALGQDVHHVARGSAVPIRKAPGLPGLAQGA